MQFETIFQNLTVLRNKSKFQIINELISACGINSLTFIRAGHGVSGKLSSLKILFCLCWSLLGILAPERPTEQP